jgi:hypothetical protein
VAKGSAALASAAATPETLTEGQIGIFNATTGLSITSGTATTPFFIAVGTANGYRRSPGTILSANNLKTNVACYTAAVTKIVDVRGICAECATDYAIKVDISSFDKSHEYGYQPFMKTVTYTSPCCTDGSASCLELAQGLRDAINDDPRQLFTAYLLDPDDVAVGASVINETTWDVDTDGCPVIRLIADAVAIADFCGIPETYTFPSGTDFVVSTQGLKCCTPASTVVTVRDVVYAKGAGGDIKYMEWADAGDAEVGPYRITESGVTTAVDLNAVGSSNYALLSLDYLDPHETAGQVMTAPKAAVVAIPCNVAVLLTLGNALDTLGMSGIDTALTACNCA